MGNIILIGIIAFLAIMTLVGYKRGLIKTVFSLLSVVIVICVVSVLTPTVKIIIRETPLYPYIQEKSQEYINSNLKKDSEESVAGIGDSEQQKLINELPLPQNIKEELIDNNTEKGYKLLEVSNFTDYLVKSIADTIVDSIAFIILFIIVVIAIKVAISLLDVIAKLPVLNFFNKSGGALFGFAEALIIIWIICIVITAFSATKWGQQLFVEINNNVFLSLIYNNNILEKLFTMFL